MTTVLDLPSWGWNRFFQQQCSLDEWETTFPARITAHHRTHFDVVTSKGHTSLAITASLPPLTVGDWVLLDAQARFVRAFDRFSTFARKSPGSAHHEQLIAANVDTVLLTVSLNHDFNLSRIERYYALCKDAGAEVVLVLTKADTCDDVAAYTSAAEMLDPLLPVLAVNALEAATVEQLMPWCEAGKTLALMGSSGVGKSTLMNQLMGRALQRTAGIRSDDSKGRHTTTARYLQALPSGAVLLDTPGMRELQLFDSEQGVKDAFAEISQWANQCRYNDCQHESEPGCRIQKALQVGELSPRRWRNYCKLQREQARNGATLAEKRARERDLGRYYRSVQNNSRKQKNRR